MFIANKTQDLSSPTQEDIETCSKTSQKRQKKRYKRSLTLQFSQDNDRGMLAKVATLNKQLQPSSNAIEMSDFFCEDAATFMEN
jgi:hypothetical protein